LPGLLRKHIRRKSKATENYQFTSSLLHSSFYPSNFGSIPQCIEM
jgi:hypothetical protein